MNLARMAVIEAIARGLKRVGATYTLPPMQGGPNPGVYPIPGDETVLEGQVQHPNGEMGQMSLQQAAAANMVLMS
jgi:hypothetical protein